MMSINITSRLCNQHIRVLKSYSLIYRTLRNYPLLTPASSHQIHKSALNNAAQPQVKQNVEEKQILRLLDKESDLPKDGITIFVKHAGQMFEYNQLLRQRTPTKEQIERIDKPQIRAAITSPTSVEDYLFLPVPETKPFPPLSKLPNIYACISKSRLTMLVVLTAMGGYAMAPGVIDLTTLSALTLGTFLQSAAANSTNQVIEVKYDRQMKRTMNRPIVRGLISREHAAVFAATSGLLGTGLLYYGVNPLTCYVGVFNYFLYTSIYTPMKRTSLLNTWVGSVVGALPPIMGWAAATNDVASGGLWLGTLLYIWQFPHFKALSWNIRKEYQKAGYMMSASYHPDMCKRVAFRHTILMTLACCLGPAVNCTTEMFILYSLPCNLWGVYLGWKFYTDGDSQSARKLFRFSLYQMPYLILMMILSKKWKTEEKTKHSESDVLNKAVT